MWLRRSHALAVNLILFIQLNCHWPSSLLNIMIIAIDNIFLSPALDRHIFLMTAGKCRDIPMPKVMGVSRKFNHLQDIYTITFKTRNNSGMKRS